ncbi:MAG: hypothetical protein HQM16_00535 [Deltaproteobacteria bacterium]|nr:hypothetical protein [Deltaproteobacteria bacterium]
MVTKVNTVAVIKNEYKSYKKKADQFFAVMNMCLEDREWDAVFLNGLHAVISISDALCVFQLGQRSTGRSHTDASKLLQQAYPTAEGKKRAGQFFEMINIKNEVEYTPRLFQEGEARTFSLKVSRFIEWAVKKLP